MKTEPIGSIPRPLFLIQTIAAFQAGTISREVLDDAYANALRDTIDRFDMGRAYRCDANRLRVKMHQRRQIVVTTAFRGYRELRQQRPGAPRASE
jgi:hypothetical protein